MNGNVIKQEHNKSYTYFFLNANLTRSESIISLNSMNRITILWFTSTD